MYDQFASDYDRFVNWDNRLSYEIPLIKKLLSEVQHPLEETIEILDAACGTGMHALALAKSGYQTAGADFSPEMINQARLNAQSANLELPFETAGFGSLTSVFGKSRFDAVLCLGNSLPHLIEDEDINFALIDFHICLKPGGVLIIQNRNFDAVMQKKERWMDPQEFIDGDEQWIFERFYDFNPDGTIGFNIVDLHRKGDSGWKSEVISTQLRPQLKEDMQARITKVGFKHAKVFGNLEEAPFNPFDSKNLILVATK